VEGKRWGERLSAFRSWRCRRLWKQTGLSLFYRDLHSRFWAVEEKRRKRVSIRVGCCRLMAIVVGVNPLPAGMAFGKGAELEEAHRSH
jgi:hypothetical protein